MCGHLESIKSQVAKNIHLSETSASDTKDMVMFLLSCIIFLRFMWACVLMDNIIISTKKAESSMRVRALIMWRIMGIVEF